MSIPKGEISFKPRTLLRVNESVIESYDVSASELHHFIMNSITTISTHVENLYRQSFTQARRPELKERPIIHVARLAMHEWNRSVFNTLNMQEVERVTTSPRILIPEAHEYWQAIEQTPFTPEIHIRGTKALDGTSGVWISLKTPPPTA
jgi:hypothetical protein